MKKALYFIALICTVSLVHAEVVHVTLLHTADLHGKFLPVTDYDGVENVGGLASLTDIIEGQRAKNSHTLLVDNGDTFQGSMASRLSDGEAFIAWMNARRYDVWNLGNHEFDWGVSTLSSLIDTFSGSVISANCVWAGPDESPLAEVTPYVIKTVGGVRIAFVGIAHPNIPYWTRQTLLEDVLVVEPATALMRVMPAVRRENPDVIVLIAHLGYNDISHTLEPALQDVVERFPDIDIIIGGHTHRLIPMLHFGNTLYTQAGYHGITLGEVHIYFDTESRRILQMRGTLIPVDTAVTQMPPDAVYTEAVMRAQEYATQPLCYIDGVLSGDVSYDTESPAQTLIAEAMAKATDADIVFHGAFRSDLHVEDRVMTYDDLYRLIPYENHVVVAHLTVDEIAALLDELMEWWGTHRFAFPYGCLVRINPDGFAGERVLGIETGGGRQLNPTNRYRVAFNSYLAASGGNRHPLVRALIDSKDARGEDISVQTRDAVKQFLLAQETYTPHVVETIVLVEERRQPHAIVTTSTPLAPGPVQFIAFAYTHRGMRSEEQASEWFAVRNMGDRPHNLKGYRFSDGEIGGTFLIRNDLELRPGEVLVFAHTPEMFHRHPYGNNPYLRVFGYGELAGRLNLGNRGDEIMMIDPQGRLADQVVYGQNIALWPDWPAESKAPNHRPGEALEKTPGGWRVTTRPLRGL